MAAWMHGTLSPEEMAKMGAVWALTAPIVLVRSIGVAEFLGVLGLILPAATRIKPGLTVLAAIGLLAIQVLAVPFHISRGEWFALPFNLIYVALTLFVIWGRTRKAPISAR